MEKYTKEEILEFQKKDARIVAENTLSHATQIVMGLGASGLDKFTLENVTKKVKETAADLFLWVFGQGELAVEFQKQLSQLPRLEANLKEKPKAVTKLEKSSAASAPRVEPPAPLLEQKKILDLIAVELGVEESTIRSSVNKWALELTKGKSQYPSNVDSVSKFIVWFNSGK